MKRETRRFLKNVMLSFSLVVAMIIFICSGIQLGLNNLCGFTSMCISASYIITFCVANEVDI